MNTMSYIFGLVFRVMYHVLEAHAMYYAMYEFCICASLFGERNKHQRRLQRFTTILGTTFYSNGHMYL